MNLSYWPVKAWALALLSLSTAYAQKTDASYDEKIKAYTTDARFLPASVLSVPLDAKVPSPKAFFGDIIGAPNLVHPTKDIYAYYQKLSQTSPFLKVETVGKGEEGKEIKLITIASTASLKKLDHYKRQLAQLADPRKVNGDVNAIIKDSKLVYFINGGLHSPEMGSPEMLMELAYRLITAQSDEIKAMRENLIIIINPVSEPDGWDKQVDWYNRYGKARKEYGDGFPRVPYWGKYVYHDNNRDGIQVSQAVSKAIYKIYYDFHPTVMLDLHESVPLLYVSTGTGPFAESADPITMGEWQTMASHDITSLTAQGLPGVFTWAYYDGGYPGYQFWIAVNHNSVGRFYETFGNGGPSTFVRDLSQQKYAGDAATSKEWYRPMPSTEKVNWSFRNNINYMQAGVLSSLTYAATNSTMLLKNFYQKGLNNIKRGKEETLKAFIIPAQQKDPVMAAYLVNQLRKQQIEVHRSKKGEYVVLLEQPYRNLAVTLLSKQEVPKDAKFPPHDDLAWTMGYLYGVEVKPLNVLPYPASELELLQNDAVYEGSISGNGSVYALIYKAQTMVLPALYELKAKNNGVKVQVMQETKEDLPAGSLLMSGLSESQAQALSKKFGLDFKKMASVPSAKEHEVTLPKVAIYHSWFNTQDEGWARFTFEERGIPYTSISKDALKKGRLKNEFDVILIPHMSGSAADFIHEIDKKYGPLPFTKTAEFPSHGMPDATEDMTGGPGFEGLAELQRFVEEGGVLITLDNASQMIAGTGLVRDLEVVPATAALFHAGSVVQVKRRSEHTPILYGFEDSFPIFRGAGPLLQTKKSNRSQMLLQYGHKPLKDEVEYEGLIMGLPEAPVKAKTEKKSSSAEPYLLSGLVKNEQLIIGHGSVFNVPVGKGKVVAFTFNPLHRFQNHHDAVMLWNALINWNHLEN